MSSKTKGSFSSDLLIYRQFRENGYAFGAILKQINSKGKEEIISELWQKNDEL